MGFGFNLLFFPLLILSGVIAFTWFLLTPAENKAKTVKWIAGLYGLGFLALMGLFGLAHWADAQRAPIQPSRTDLIGVYRVDRNMYPGPQANWQFQHHRILITEQDSLILEILNNGKVRKRFARAFEPVPVSGLRHFRWQFTDGTDSLYHQIIATEPIMVRSHSSFYYVFPSNRYGNMFFRKVE